MNTGAVDRIGARIPAPETYALMTTPVETARLARAFAVEIARRQEVPVGGCQWVGPWFTWEATSGDLAVAIDAKTEADDYGLLSAVPEIAVECGADGALPGWLSWFLQDLTRTNFRLQGSMDQVELVDENPAMLQAEVDDAVVLIRRHWPAASVNLQLLVRNVVFVRGVAAGCAVDERVFGAVAVPAYSRSTTFALAAELLSATTHLSYFLRARHAPPMENGHRLRQFPGSKLRNLSEGLALALSVAQNLVFSNHVEPLGYVRPEYVTDRLAELRGVIDVLGDCAVWTDWGVDTWRELVAMSVTSGLERGFEEGDSQ